eukprot:PhF_6_TR37596/c1_g1_i1/m.55817
MQGTYKKSLHQFFLKVHPDFFSRNREWQRANERAVAQLNELLEWGKAFKKGIYRPPPAPQISVSFHIKLEDDGTGGGEVTSTFALPKPFHVSEAFKGPAERAINSFLRDLLVKAKCLDQASEQLSKAQDGTLQSLEEAKRPTRRKSRTREMKTLMDETSESLAETWFPEDVPEVEDLIEADLILFSRELSPKQCAFALETLRAGLPQMKYTLWYEVPLLFAHRYGVGIDLDGTISVPWDFDPQAFCQMLTAKHDDIKTQKERVEAVAKKIEQDISMLCSALDLDDIVISCPHKHSLGVLDLLLKNSHLLRAAGVHKLSVEISDNIFGLRKNGVLLIPYTATLESLTEYLDKVRDRMEGARSTYAMAKEMIEGITWHVKEFRSAVKPKGVEVFTHECTYAQRLTWIGELCSLSGRLAQWDWSEFTFMLGPTLDLNWDNKAMILPWNFDGDGFMKYVEETHKNAKQSRRDNLMKEEAERRSQEDLKVMRNNAADANTLMDTGVPEHIQKQYMMSHADDDMHTEGPIASRTTFESDEDVKDHLEWEGFYRNPTTMGKEAMVDEDEKERVMASLNKTYREEAMKELANEYESSQRGKRYFKTFGDKLGIKDPRLKVRGQKVHVGGTGAMPAPSS